MTALTEPLVHDELEGVISWLCDRFPGRARRDVEEVVAGVFADLQCNATVTAHLIPLTLNRSRRLLGSGTALRHPGDQAGSSMSQGGRHDISSH